MYKKNRRKVPVRLRVELLAILTDALYLKSLFVGGQKRFHLCGAGRHSEKAHKDLLALLHEGIALDAQHPGLLHTYIHIQELDRKDPVLWQAALDISKFSRGNIGHFAHMPNHVYWRRGKYKEAIAANQLAIKADLSHFKEGGFAQPHHYFYYHHLHNYHFLSNLYILQGNKDATYANSKELRSKVVLSEMNELPTIRDYYSTLYHQALVRFGDYHTFLKEAPPKILGEQGKLLLMFLKGVSYFHLKKYKDFDTQLDLLKKWDKGNRDPLTIVTSRYLAALKDYKNGLDIASIAKKYQTKELLNAERVLFKMNPNIFYFWSAVLLYQMAEKKNKSLREYFKQQHYKNFPDSFLSYKF